MEKSKFRSDLALCRKPNDYIGDANNDWKDLFGRGTSGYNHGATCYQPWGNSTNYVDYYAYGTWNCNLSDQSGMADWGYNAISNGGNQKNCWRTLSQLEWDYVLFTRKTTSGIRFAKAIVNSVNGILLLPDNWDESAYSLNDANVTKGPYDANVITDDAWETLEVLLLWPQCAFGAQCEIMNEFFY